MTGVRLTALHVQITREAEEARIKAATGELPGGSRAAYASSEAAVLHMTKALKWARYDIRVNALAPGYFTTDLNRDILASDYGKAMMKRIPQRRVG